MEKWIWFDGRGIHFGRSEYEVRKAKPKDIITMVLWIAAFIVIAVIVFPNGMRDSKALNNALTAFSKGDQNLWQEQFHPEADENIKHLETFTASMKWEDIDLSGNLSRSNSIVVGTADAKYGENAVKLETTVSCDGIRYIVTGVYVKDEKGSGLVYFHIRYNQWDKPSPTPGFYPPVRNNKG